MKRSNNRSAIRLLALAGICIGFLSVILFYAISRQEIKKNAADTLTSFVLQPDAAGSKETLDIDFVRTDESGDSALTALDQGLLDYYDAHRTELPLDQVLYYSAGGQQAYFVARPASPKNTAAPAGSIRLYYTDVTFVSSLVRRACLIMAAVVLLFSLILGIIWRKTLKSLDEKDQRMKDFFSNASHELKTPLMAIQGYTDGLESGLLTPEEACPVLSKETERMGTLIHTILELSKLDSQSLQPQLEQNDVREILYDAIQVIEPAARQASIELDLNLPKPLFRVCDEDMIFSAVSNILTNSIRYARSRITISASRQKNSDQVTIRIAHDGEPIDAKDLPHLFDRFYKAEKGQSGIGLALAREYIERHKGTISVQSGESETVFLIRF